LRENEWKLKVKLMNESYESVTDEHAIPLEIKLASQIFRLLEDATPWGGCDGKVCEELHAKAENLCSGDVIAFVHKYLKLLE
jgi:hypothetical protein